MTDGPNSSGPGQNISQATATAPDRYYGALTITDDVQWTDPGGLHQFLVYFNTVMRFENFGGSSSNVGASERVIGIVTSTPVNNGDASAFHFDFTETANGPPSNLEIVRPFIQSDFHQIFFGSVEYATLTFQHNIRTSYVLGTAEIELFNQAGGPIGLLTADFKLLKGEIKFSSSSTSISSAYNGLALTGTANINGTGNSGNNVINGNEGNNVLNGLAGNDTLFGNLGNDTLKGSLGSDRMEGGPGNDTYYVDSTGDRVVETSNAGTDRVISTVSFSLSSTVENLTLSGSADIRGTGSSLANTIIGNSGDNILLALSGNDTVKGLSGDDVLIGRGGKDVMDGGTGADRYDFDSRFDSVVGANRDTLCFSHAQGDEIDLSTIDARVHTTGNQAFTYIGNAAFSSEGQVRYDGTVLQGDMTGDGVADFEIRVVSSTMLVGGDFIL